MEAVKSFGKFVAKFPFAGRVVIRPMYRRFRHADDNNRTARFAWLSKLLGFMVIGHGMQARMGILALKQMFLKKVSAFWGIVFLGYTVVNIAVSIAQFTLLLWTLYVYFGNKHVHPGKPNEPFTGGELLVMFLVTMGGQLLFSYGKDLYM